MPICPHCQDEVTDEQVEAHAIIHRTERRLEERMKREIDRIRGIDRRAKRKDNPTEEDDDD